MPNRNIEGNYRYKYQGQEKDPETGMEAFELRLWDSRIGRWITTDPYRQHASPYLGMGNNPLNLIDPNGGETADWDDIIFKDSKGNTVATYYTNDDSEDIIINLPISVDNPENVNLNTLFESVATTFRNKSAELNADAFAINVSGEVAFKEVGAQIALSYLEINKGDNKGDFGFQLQGNYLVGLEASGSITGTFFTANQTNPDLNRFRGLETGLQGSIVGINLGYNQGVELQNPIRIDNKGGYHLQPLFKETYTAETFGFSFTKGVIPLPFSVSGYLGYSDYFYRSDR